MGFGWQDILLNARVTSSNEDGSSELIVNYLFQEFRMVHIIKHD